MIRRASAFSPCDLPAAMARLALAAAVLLALEFHGHGRAAAQAPAAEDSPVPAGATDQSAENAAPEEGAPAPASDKSLGKMVLDSGLLGTLFYIVLFAFSVVAMMVIMERFVNLRRSKILPPVLVARLNELASRRLESPEAFTALAAANPSPLGRILAAGASRAGRPLTEVEKTMEDAAMRELATLRGRNRALSVVANVAPLVGLQGTVVGMIFAFNTASQVGLGRGELLAEGIYLALFTTAIGLTIAIPAILAAAWFNGRIERYMLEMEEALVGVLPSFARMESTWSAFAPTASANGSAGSSSADGAAASPTDAVRLSELAPEGLSPAARAAV